MIIHEQPTHAHAETDGFVDEWMNYWHVFLRG